MGYNHPIVALTANAVQGQADIFLGNGFDDFISKPIDIRQMNTVLHKLVREKQPQEIIDAANKQNTEKKDETVQITALPLTDPKFAEIFTRDAMRILSTLEEISAGNDYAIEDTMRTYIINMHGIKSALANMGKMDLSAVALKLEAAGRDGMLDLVESETSSFIGSLREFVEDLNPQVHTDEQATDEDPAYLHKMLLEVKAACENYDEKTADEALAELRKMKWSPTAEGLLRNISELLLHSDFDEAADTIGKFIS